MSFIGKRRQSLPSIEKKEDPGSYGHIGANAGKAREREGGRERGGSLHVLITLIIIRQKILTFPGLKMYSTQEKVRTIL